METLAHTLATLGMIVATALGFHHEALAPIPMLGDVVQPIAGTTYALSGSGVSATSNSFILASLTIPQTGQKLRDADFSDTFYVTVEPGKPRQEISSCTTVTQNANGSATLSGCTRALSPIPPYTASTTLQVSHGGGAAVIFSDPPQFFRQFAAKANDETITGQWTFTVFPITPSSPAASETTAGIVELATGAEAAASTLSGSLGRLALPTAISTSTYNTSTAANVIPVTGAGKIIDPKFVFNGTALTFPSSASTASSTALLNDGSGNTTWNLINHLLVASSSPVTVGTASTTILNATIPANTLGTSNMLHISLLDAYVSSLDPSNILYIEYAYGAAGTTTLQIAEANASGISGSMNIDIYIKANGTTNSQKTSFNQIMKKPTGQFATSTTGGFATSTIATNSTIAQPLFVIVRGVSAVMTTFTGYVEALAQ